MSTMAAWISSGAQGQGARDAVTHLEDLLRSPSKGNGRDLCRFPKCRKATEADKLLLADWKDAGHINKAGVSFSFFPFKKEIQLDPSCQQPMKCPAIRQRGT